MSLTRANVESILIRRCGKLLTAADLNGTTVDGTNADLNDPLGYAIRKLGYTVTTPTSVADADVALVATSDYDACLDLAELRTLETVLNEVIRLVSVTVGPHREDLSDMAKALEAMIARKRKQIQDEYGTFGTVTAGVIDLDFMEKGD